MNAVRVRRGRGPQLWRLARNRTLSNPTRHTVFSNYRIVNQVSAGRDGVSYRAIDVRSDAEVLLLALDARLESAAPETPDRPAPPPGLAADAPHGAAAFSTSASIRMRPFLALEIIAAIPGTGPRFRFATWDEAVEGALGLAQGLAEAHRMGLVHGALGEETVTRQESSPFVIDWTGLEVGTPRAAPARDRWPPGPRQRPGGEPTPPDDVVALGTLLAGWLPAEPSPALPTAPRKPGPRSKPSSSGCARPIRRSVPPREKSSGG